MPIVSAVAFFDNRSFSIVYSEGGLQTEDFPHHTVTSSLFPLAH